MTASNDRLFDQALGALQNGNMADAEKSLGRLLRSQPDHIGALNVLGVVLTQVGKYAEAEKVIQAALKINSSSDATFYNYGLVLRALKRPSEALERISQALAINPAIADTWNSRGAIFSDLKRYREALEDFDRALARQPRFAGAFYNKGKALAAIGRRDEALAAFDKASAIDPGFVGGWIGRGNILIELGLLEPALAAFDAALNLDPNSADACHGRGGALAKLGRHEDALTAYGRALALDPDMPYLEGLRLQVKLQLCDWTTFDEDCARIRAAIRGGKPASEPFPLALIESSAVERLACAQMFVADHFSGVPPLRQGRRYDHDRIKVAYVSSDYRIHPISYLISEVFALHDRSRVEVIGISLGPDDKSDMRARIGKSVDQFHDVAKLDDQEVADLMLKMEIDIAVDLNNFTELARPGIFARRPAPIQISYLGFPATTAADFIDYDIVDRFVVPEDQQQYWTEKMVYMPDSYLVHDTISKRGMPAEPPRRAAAGLPDGAFVFCCFNNTFKITPPIFAVWMRLLRDIDGSVAWLSHAGPATQANLRKEAAKAGIDPARVIFAPRVERNEDHLSRQQLADLFLDTLPYNAHTTAADALWAGLPVVTCAGETFPARVAGSLLRAIGAPELITDSLKDYEALALQLARDPARLAALRAKIVGNRDTFPLFDTGRLTRHLEAAYETMQDRHRGGLSPASFAVAPID